MYLLNLLFKISKQLSRRTIYKCTSLLEFLVLAAKSFPRPQQQFQRTFATLAGFKLAFWRHHNTVGVLLAQVTLSLEGCHSSSVGVLQHPAAPRVVNFPTEEDSVVSNLARWEQVASRVTLRPFGDDVPGGNNPLVNHLGELHVPERGKV